MTWALRHQLFYLGIVVLFLALMASLIIYPRLNREPTCFDGRQNGAETGVDCGGGCALACLAEVENVKVLWARSFEVVPGRYNALAYLVNHNRNKIVESMRYRFRFADENNLYLGERRGEAHVPSGGSFAVFEGGIEFFSSIPVYTTFEIESYSPWLQVTEEEASQVKVLVSDIVLTNPDTAPALSAKIENNSLFMIPETGVIAILYDAEHNAVNISRTLVEDLAGEEVRTIRFTWPEPLPRPIALREIIPIFNIKAIEWR